MTRGERTYANKRWAHDGLAHWQEKRRYVRHLLIHTESHLTRRICTRYTACNFKIPYGQVVKGDVEGFLLECFRRPTQLHARLTTPIIRALTAWITRAEK